MLILTHKLQENESQAFIPILVVNRVQYSCTDGHPAKVVC